MKGLNLRFFDRIICAFKGAEAAPRPEGVQVSAFGKHPGWDDHIDGIELLTHDLVNLKRVLYLGGVSGNLDSGAWDKLPPADRLGQFDHVFIQRTNEETLVGLMAASKDRKGRGKYPLVVCADCGNVDSWGMIKRVGDELSSAMLACLATESADEVRAIIQRWSEALRQLAREPAGQSESDTGNLLDPLEASGGWEKPVLSLLYHIQAHMGMFKPAVQTGKRSNTTEAPEMCVAARLPSAGQAPLQAAWLWTRFLQSQLASGVSILAIASSVGGWVDLLVGEPGTQDLFCLLAGRGQIPLTTDIPYNITPEFIEKMSGTIERLGATRARLD